MELQNLPTKTEQDLYKTGTTSLYFWIPNVYRTTTETELPYKKGANFHTKLERPCPFPLFSRFSPASFPALFPFCTDLRSQNVWNFVFFFPFCIGLCELPYKIGTSSLPALFFLWYNNEVVLKMYGTSKGP